MNISNLKIKIFDFLGGACRCRSFNADSCNTAFYRMPECAKGTDSSQRKL